MSISSQKEDPTRQQQQQQQKKAILECEGKAAVALEAFRVRKHELEKEGRAKPDMIAYKELKHTFGSSSGYRRVHGEIPGVPIGLVLRGRGEAAIVGVHCNILSGIDGLKDEPCYAVCLSGGYVDDKEDDDDGKIYYTGSGGQKGGKQVSDQVENTANQSLLLSYKQKVPIRVLRGKYPEYYYDGLYRCVDWTHEPSLDGPKIYQFVLQPIQGKVVSSANRVSLDEAGIRSSKSSSSWSRTKGAAQHRLMSKINEKKRKKPTSTDNPSATKAVYPRNDPAKKPMTTPASTTASSSASSSSRPVIVRKILRPGQMTKPPVAKKASAVKRSKAKFRSLNAYLKK